MLNYRNISSIGTNKNLWKNEKLSTINEYSPFSSFDCFITKFSKTFSQFVNIIVKIVTFKKENKISFTSLILYPLILLSLKNFFKFDKANSFKFILYLKKHI